MATISAARKAAFAILMGVERGQSHSDDLLRGKAVNGLSAPDRNLATALVLGVLRNQIRLDHDLQSLLKRPNGKLDAEIRISLRLGAFQLLHMDRIPDRAAIDESVELAKQAGHNFASKMVNAVLRKLAGTLQAAERGRIDSAVHVPGATSSHAPQLSSPAAFLALWGERPEESVAEVALAESHPAWMVERWAGFYGFEAARQICRHGQTQPALAIRFANPAIEAELEAVGIQLAPGELLTAARTVVSGDVAATAAFKEGRVRLQDEGSQLVGEIAGQGSKAGTSAILDCCAAPGGKTLILAERNPEARILACESSPPRLAQLQSRLAAYADRVECRLADTTTLTEGAAFDVVLADVPCSGTGTLGRNPEIRYRLSVEDLPRQAERQRAILVAALRCVRPGGRVVYSTCSLEPEENEQVVASVLAENAKARLVSLESCIGDLESRGILASNAAARLKATLTAEGTLRLLPGAFRTDGFYIALIEKSA